MKNKFLYHFILLLAFFAVIIGCSQQDDTCRKSRNVNLNATFYLDSINTRGRYVTPKFLIDSLTVRGIGSDSLIYDKEKTNVMKLPLQVFNETSSFALIMNEIIDTITIKHKNLLEFLSIECGSIRTYSIDTIYFTNHFIDSISIQQPKVNTIEVENIQIYHHK